MYRNRKIFTVLGLFFCVLWAQDNQEIKLKSVSVSGNSMTSESMITYTAGLRPGSTVSAGEFTRAVKRLWQLGIFRDIQIVLNAEDPDGLDITIQVEENPVLGAITYDGNKKLKDSKFEEELDLKVGQRIKPNTIHDAVEDIKDLYAEDGYLLVKIEPELVETKNTTIRDPKIQANTRDLIFHITEGKKVRVRNIIFDGNSAFSDFRLRRALKETKQQRWYLFWRSPYDRDKYEEDLNNLRTFYRNHGYRDITVTSDSIGYTEDRRHMNIVIHLEEGPQYKYRNFSWEGNTLFTDEDLAKQLKLAKGDIFNEETFNLALFDRVQGLYMDRG
ncbi:MAG: hypothetical protein GXO90_01505, partial [FCB group bacterium]|nr:hypothetical protein [FCB group bacterium]